MQANHNNSDVVYWTRVWYRCTNYHQEEIPTVQRPTHEKTDRYHERDFRQVTLSSVHAINCSYICKKYKPYVYIEYIYTNIFMKIYI